MSLPKLNHPTFETFIPSTGAKVKFRPFVVREHKTLMKAVEFEDQVNLVETFKRLIDDCTFNKLDVGKLAMFDVDWLYLKIKSASTGSLNPIRYRCGATVTEIGENGENVERECGQEVTVRLDTEAATIKVPDARVIYLTPEIAMTMRWPTFDDYARKGELKSVVDVTEEFVLDCVETIAEPNRTYTPGTDFSREELRAFIEDLTDEAVDKIKAFIENIPDVEMDVELHCPKCGQRANIHLVGLEDFLE